MALAWEAVGVRFLLSHSMVAGENVTRKLAIDCSRPLLIRHGYVMAMRLHSTAIKAQRYAGTASSGHATTMIVADVILIITSKTPFGR